MALYFTR